MVTEPETMPSSVQAPRFTETYIAETLSILRDIYPDDVEELAGHLALAETIYVCGLGGSSAHASHMANDLQKLCGKHAICPTDNVPLMTALANDEDFETWLAHWFDMQGLPVGNEAALFLSVGGGNGRTSKSLVAGALGMRERGHPVLAIVGRDGGELAKIADCVLVIPNLYPERVTPHVEGITSVLLHLLVTHPALARFKPKW
jgi:D-sedoheptulose 7-phosphate isomerase